MAEQAFRLRSFWTENLSGVIQSCRKPRKVHIFNQNEANLDDSWPVESEYDGYEGDFSNDEGLVEEEVEVYYRPIRTATSTATILSLSAAIQTSSSHIKFTPSRPSYIGRRKGITCASIH